MNLQLQKPSLVSVIAWTTLASGIVNILWGIAALSTFIGFICAPLSVLPIILGVFEIIYAAKLLGNSSQPVQPSTNIAIFEIACILFGNVFGMVVGILSLVFYNDLTVKEYFARLNGTLDFVPVTPPTPPSQPEPAPFPQPDSAPAIEESVPPPAEESPNPPSEEIPVKPKRGPRKVAKN